MNSRQRSCHQGGLGGSLDPPSTFGGVRGGLPPRCGEKIIKNSYQMMSYGDLALHTNSHRCQDGWAKPSAPPDLIQYEFLLKIRPDFGHLAGRGGAPPTSPRHAMRTSS